MPSMMTGTLAGAAFLAVVLAAPLCALGQPGGPATDDDRERAFVDALRREEPAAANRYVALRDAREHAIAEVQRVEAKYRAAGTEFRSLFFAQLKSARRTFAETSLALLDFLEARDRQAIARYQDEINRINAILEQRRQPRAELEKLLAE